MAACGARAASDADGGVSQPAGGRIEWAVPGCIPPRSSGEINSAFATLVRERSDALLVAGDQGFFTSRRVQLTALSARHALPATYSTRDFAEVGGLMAYGTSLTDAYRQIGVYAGRILKGANPADLPVCRRQVRTGHQSANGETPRPRRATLAARPRRRGDRMSAPGKAGAIQPVEVRPK